MTSRNRALATLAAAMLCAPWTARADTVASLLGNFTVNQFSALELAPGALVLRHTLVFGQLPALRELHAADANRDGVTTETERNDYAGRMAVTVAGQLRIEVDGTPVALQPARWKTSLPEEQGGFSLRIDFDFSGRLPEAGTSRSLTFSNAVYDGRFGWQEIVVRAGGGIAVFDTDAFSTSLTDGLTESVRELPASGPLAERSVRMAYREGSAPAGAQVLAPRPGTVARAQADQADTGWIQQRTRRVVDLIAAPDAPLHAAAWALLAAMLLGALHSFAPGHGKTVVGAYLIGSRATARHAAFLGLTVTVTHTIGVFAVGLATLAASAYVVPERLFPILGLASALIVLAMGLVLLRQRWPQARVSLSPHAFRALAAPARKLGGSYVLASVNRAHADLGWHSHGGTWHTHMPPGAAGEPVTWRGLLALGVSGGLVPCPSAMVLLLAAIALNKTTLGLLLVVAFSAGLALTLTAIGFAFLYARNRIPAGTRAPQWTKAVPVASAAAITLIGVLLCYAALAGGRI